VGQYFKVPESKIAQAIAGYVPANNRSQILDAGSNRYVLDAYNANPSSMRQAIESFSQMACPKKTKVAVLGDMLELGAYSAAEHEAIADAALACRFDRLILVGKAFEPVAQTRGILHFAETSLLSTWLKANPFQDACILLKASRGIGLEKILHLP
ncbi:MAG: UDP-N-acetylmuramoylalanyl-D-glutamyl-2, 6-diaminopimelate--D-alanyl-D-alanine ligase, partial [Saprospiraceae bacterium]|nr:UDP-N-acetylmuramoylalanyl-D-glutamyl-2, 6-diaminopimelate--D-alanyl-D-alanine ligase [Saprospiraceae bacterium]